MELEVADGPDDVDELCAGVRAGDRTALGRALTLVESTRAEHRAAAQALLQRLVPAGGPSQRVGITGVPGVGKSTFIDTLGTWLTAKGHRVAVLAVDPTSTRTGGSILGDKTRMANLATDAAAFIRPSPSAGTLGGVTRSTRESIIVFEAAGYDVILVETIGVGQSETIVADMVDFFLVLAITGAGDELQGIKRGVLELADMVVVNKADGDNVVAARAAARDLDTALRLVAPASPSWRPPVLTCSSLVGDGIEAVWGQIELHRQTLDGTGELDEMRRAQQVGWMWALVEARLLDALHSHEAVAAQVARLEQAVRDSKLPPSVAADRLLDAFLS